MSNHKLYVPTGLEVKVKVGDKVEAGDILSEGIVKLDEVVKHKGIGAGRVQYVKSLQGAYKDSDMNVNRRNFEMVARTAVDHVKITDPDGLGEYLPDQIVNYEKMEKAYVPRPGNKETLLDSAKGLYLEKPYDYFTIGTRITPSVIASLKKTGVKSVIAHKDPPPFEPQMIRLVDIPAHEEDFMHVLNSTYIERRLTSALAAGTKSNLKGPSPIAGLAYSVGFGEKKASDMTDEDMMLLEFLTPEETE